MQGLRGEKQYRAREIPVELVRADKLKTDSKSSTVMEFATAIPMDGHDYSNFRTVVTKLIFMAP